MQSSLLKTISFLLIINVKFSRSCYSTICHASCYWHHKGFDFGYCKNGLCQCAPPIVYVFDGVGRDLSDSAIQNSLGNNNVIQRTISNNKQKAVDTFDELTETTVTETKINTENRRKRLQRLPQKPAEPENSQKFDKKTSDDYASKLNLNVNINNNNELKYKKGKNELNKKKPIIQVDQKLGGDSTDSSDYELKRTTNKKVSKDEEENNNVETVVQYSEEFVTVEDSNETSEEEK